MQPPSPPPPSPQAPVDKLAELIRIPTISAPTDGEEDEAAFVAFREALPELFPSLHQVATRELVGDRGILYHLPGVAPSLLPVLLLAHWDVVPPGDRTLWEFEPFSGEILDGRVRGRGALDDRGMLAAILEGADRLAAAGERPARDVYIALGGDEENSGHRGAGRIAALFAERGLHFSFVLDEGGAVATDQLAAFTDRPVALIGTAQKGYLTLQLTAGGPGGHASTPPRRSAIGDIARAIAAIEQYRFPIRFGKTAKGMFQALGHAAAGVRALMLSAPTLFRPILVRALQAQAETNALLRTTAAPVIIAGGERANVVSTSATATVNLRIIPGETTATATEQIRSLVSRFDVEVEPETDSMHEPVLDSPTSGTQWDLFARLCCQTWPNVVVSPHLMTGTTDSSYYTELSSHVYRFIPMEVDSAVMRGAHAPNEYIHVDAWEKMLDFFELLYRSLDYGDGAKPTKPAGEP